MKRLMTAMTPARTGFAALTVSAAVIGAMQLMPASAPAPLECPAGYEAMDPADVARERIGYVTPAHQELLHTRYGKEFCIRAKFTESMMDVREKARTDRAPLPGALHAAAAQKAAITANKATVPNANGSWQPYGVGPQISLPEFYEGARDGIPEVAGRADSFAYDPVAKRLFVAITYGGIWMSEAVNGDVGTIGDNWVSIGDKLPTQVTSAVGWTPAGGGRVIALTGEHTQGGNTYVGLGAFWSDDLGATWHYSEGTPDGAGAARIAVDNSNPNIIYAATHKGLFRSTDAGSSFVNVNLPVSEDCTGTVEGKCQLANVVSDVTIRQPGGIDATGLLPTVCDAKGCSVLAAVGYRAGAVPYADGSPQSPGNGLYRSETGEPGTFVRVEPLLGEIQGVTGGLVPVGFTPNVRIGRIEMSAADGPLQDHNYVYAIVEDTVLFNGGIPLLDLPLDQPVSALPVNCDLLPDGDPRFICEQYAGGFSPTSINGVYVSNDFGSTWIKLADDIELTYNLTTGSALVGAAALGVGPGVQSWYNLWIKPDPTQAILSVPTRVTFGMEEIWQNNLNIPVTGLEQTPSDFGVFGAYFAGNTCLFVGGVIGPPLPVCPVYDGIINGTTTHPDQHDGISIPDDTRGGVWLFAANDGGVYKQHSANPLTDPFANNKWGNGANKGFFTLFNYGISVAKDGTVWYGLQDNASGKIEPTGRHVRTYVGDGVYTAVNPDASNIAYVMTPGLSLNRTNDGGRTHTSIAPDTAVGTAHFLSPFRMDPKDPNHLIAAGTMVAETLNAEGDATWTTVFDLGVDEASGQPHQTRSLALDVEGDAAYAGWCGPCQVVVGVAPGGNLQFQRGIATNVGGDKPPMKGTSDGWHQASANGLPNRYIYNIEIDPADPRTIYVVLGDYSTSRWLTTGQYLDENPNIGEGYVFKSTDAGENFVDITGDLPRVITTAILKRGNQLIVGNDLGVFISSDLDGTSWAPLGDLPAVPVNEFVLDPADDRKLFAGTFGRGVQTYTFATSVADDVVDPVTPAPVASSAPRARFGGSTAPALLVLMLGAAFLRRRLR